MRNTINGAIGSDGLGIIRIAMIEQGLSKELNENWEVARLRSELLPIVAKYTANFAAL